VSPGGGVAIAAALLALFVGVFATTAFGASQKGTVKVVKLKPFTVRGTGFKSGERVTVKLSGGVKGTTRGTAAANGTVTVSFPKTTKVTACTSYVLRAVGAAGTRVTFKPKLKSSCKATAAVKFEGTSVVISGTRFQPGEKVTLTFVANETPHKRTVKASPAGVIKVDFGRLPISECSPYTLTIVGSLGSRVSMSQDALPC
jgi:hypothetical protein